MARISISIMSTIRRESNPTASDRCHLIIKIVQSAHQSEGEGQSEVGCSGTVADEELQEEVGISAKEIRPPIP
jgi:hypothetical protein